MKFQVAKKTVAGLAVAAAAMATPNSSEASDHIDGLKTALDVPADITDLYTFTSPRDPNKLVMIMNVHGLAFSGSRFSNAVDYKFRIRPVDATTLAPSKDPHREQSVVCSFSGGFPVVDARQRATCKFDFGSSTESISFDTRGPGYKAGGSGTKNGIRVFAGVRSDSWFLDLIKTVKFSNGENVSRSEGSNGLHGQNVLSIVVELDKNRLAGPLLAVTAQTVRK